MHEATVARNIIEVIESEISIANCKKIYSVKLRIGELSGIYPESLEYYFYELSKNTILENAKLYFEKAPIKVKCTACSAEFEIQNLDYDCPNCKSSQYHIIGGDELEIINMEVE
ncbi:MAG: [NiFe] hydrogenase nickel incorporation protein HypA [Ignavibacteriae bacterium]|nr:MAG: [NiFe] hydrogenase nickel incorporation protein HypA [Ignavibacteriota bacterium]